MCEVCHTSHGNTNLSQVLIIHAGILQLSVNLNKSYTTSVILSAAAASGCLQYANDQLSGLEQIKRVDGVTEACVYDNSRSTE